MLSVVSPFEERAEEPAQLRMVNGFSRFVPFEVFLCYVGRVRRPIHKNVVPGLISLRLGLIRLVPLFVGETLVVDVNNHSAIVVSLVKNHISDLELLLFHWLQPHNT